MSDAEDQAKELFGRESSSGEEESSSEESSGEQENERRVEGPEDVKVAPGGEGEEGEEGEGEGEGEEGEGEGAQSVNAELDTSSSSSSGESGSASEGEDNEDKSGGVASESSSWKQQDEPQGAESVDTTAPSNDAALNAQKLFGESSSSSSSDSDDGGGVIGLGGGSDIEEGEEGEREAGDNSPATVKASNTAQGEEGGDGEMEDGARESEDGTGPSTDRPSQTVEGLFGDAGDLSSSDSEAGDAVRGDAGDDVRGEASEVVRELAEEGEAEVPRINVEIPRCSAALGTDQFFVKLPNFLSVETRPFDPALYEDEVEEDNEILDEEGRARLKLKVENTIRWRYSQDESGNEVRESNARVVRWSDGTMSLYLGSEIFDIHKQLLQGEFSHLFVRQGTGLQGQAVFQSKLTFRPHSTDSQTHRKMTLSIADRFSKAQKIRVLPAVGLDPESQKKEKIKKEEERLRAAVRRENQQKRVRERNSQRGLTANYIEPDREDDDEGGASVAAIKSSFRRRLTEARGGRGGGVWGGAESEEGESSEEEGVERLMRAKKEEGESRKRHIDLPEVDVTQKKQPRRKLLHSDDSEESD